MRISEYEKELGVTVRTVMQDVRVEDRKAQARAERARDNLLLPVTCAQRVAAQHDRQRAAAGLPPL